MTTKTTLQQNCTATKDALGSQRFQVDNAITFVAPGDLPGPCIFVFQITTASAPKLDTFVRVGSIQDITQLVIGRDAAILTKGTQYVTAGFTVTYNDVNTATAAKQLIQSRVDQLIADWRTFNLAFTNPDFVTFPLQDPGLVAAKKAAYIAARAAKAAADTASAPLAAAVVAKQAEATAAADKQLLLQNIYLECTTAKNTVHPLVAAETVFRQAATTFLAAVQSATTLGDAQAYATAFATAMALETNDLKSPLAAFDASFVAACAQKQGAAASAASARANADAAIGAAKRASIIAAQTAASAQTSLEQALADAVAVCPTFDPAAV